MTGIAVVVPLFLLMFCTGTPPLHSQEWQRTGGDFHDVQFTPGGAIVFVGQFGTVLISDDDGATWRRPRTGTWKRLRTVGFRDALHGVAGGDEGTMVRTDDGGYSWDRFDAGLTGTIRTIRFASDSVGYGLLDSGRVLRTTDGGDSWSVLADSIPGFADALAVRDDTTLFAATSAGTIYRSGNGGDEWEAVFDDPALTLTGIAFGSGGMIGYACSIEHRILVTRNGGEEWTEAGRIDSGLAPLSVTVSGSGNVYVSGERERRDADPKPDGLLAVSRDQGESWERLEPFRIPLSNASSGIGFEAVAAGFDRIAFAGNAGAILVEESLRNESWIGASGTMTQFPSLDRPYPMYRLAFSDADSGIATANSWGSIYTRYFRTFDGGLTWHFRFNRLDQNYLNIFPFGNGEWLVFVRGAGLLDRSTDGGTIWLDYDPDVVDPRPVTVRDGTFVDRMHAFAACDAFTQAAGLHPALFRTTDGAASWEHVVLNGIEPFSTYERIAFPTTQTGYLLGNRSGGVKGYELVRTTDAGETWESRLSFGRDEQRFFGLHFTTPSTGFLVEGAGDSTGVVFRTEDGGETWDSLAIADGSPRNVVFFERMNGFILGYPSLLLRTTDGGDSWNREELWPEEVETVYPELQDIALLPDEHTAVLIGSGVTARKTYDDRLVSVDAERPSERGSLRLEAVPNPTTGSRLTLEWEGNGSPALVELYDLLGRPVMRGDLQRRTGSLTELDVAELPGGQYRAVVRDRFGNLLGSAPVMIVR